MSDVGQPFFKKYPNLALLICGVAIFALPVGFGVCVKLLEEYNRMPDQFRFWLPLLGIVQAVIGLTGFVLISLSAFRAARRWGDNRQG